jgi:hypothetical protein
MRTEVDPAYILQILDRERQSIPGFGTHLESRHMSFAPLAPPGTESHFHVFRQQRLKPSSIKKSRAGALLIERLNGKSTATINHLT